MLILVVLVQNSKGGGLDTSNSMVNQMGSNVAQSTDTVEKVTWYLAAGIAVVCLVAVFLGNPATSNNGAVDSDGIDGGTVNTTGTTTPTPGL